MGRKNIACVMRRSRPPGSGCSAKAALASLFSLRCCSLAWRRRRSLRARSQSQAILDQQPCSRRDHRASPSIRGRASTDAAPDGTSRSIARRHFQTLCSISGCLFRTRARHSRADKEPQFRSCPGFPRYPRDLRPTDRWSTNLRSPVMGCSRLILEI
jgi:hypothetical protein